MPKSTSLTRRTKHIQLLVSDKEYKLLQQRADVLGLSPGTMIRMEMLKILDTELP